MWFLYLDESGDLGFDFVNKKPSNYFTITVLAIHGTKSNRRLTKAVKKTIQRKLNPKNKRRRLVQELKGSTTAFSIKKYFLEQLESNDVPFALFSLTLDKKKLYERLTKEKSRVYNFLARKILDQIQFENAETRVYLYIDKSKSKPEIADFNQYIEQNIQARLDPKVLLHIIHENSHLHAGLQAADLFCWGIFRCYERKIYDWYECYKHYIRLNELFYSQSKPSSLDNAPA